MSVVWPEKFAPQSIGQPTKLSLPGVSTRSALQIANVADGVTVTKSRFWEQDGRSDVIKRQSDTVLVVFGMHGLSRLRCLKTDASKGIEPGSCLLVCPTESGVERYIPPRIATANLVVSIRRNEASRTLRDATEDFVQSSEVLVTLKRFSFDFAAFEKLFNEALTSVELLKIEGHCLEMIAASFAAYGKDGLANLQSQVTEFLNPRLAERITLEDVAKHVGMNRTKLNALLRAECGLTVFELLRDLRVQRARRLKIAGMPMSHIANDTGFSSASHLCHVLRKSPSDCSR